MRVSGRFHDESGAATVVVGVVIVVLVGMLALTIDSGLLWTKYRAIRTANDAAALAAALSCAQGEGLAAADAKADELAVSNVGDAVAIDPAVYPEGCEPEGGKVTVRYGGNQALMFGPAIGVSSPRPVVASTTAIWGGAGAAMQVAPLMLSAHRLSTCGIPDGELYDGKQCFFWWDNGTPNDTTALTNAEWGLMDLTTWGIASNGACTGTVSQSDVGTWISQGFPGSLVVPPAPKYVCRGSGFQGNALNNDVNAMEGDLLYFPVNDQNQQVDRDGLLCRPELLDGQCTVDKYAIVGFAVLEIVHIWTGMDAQERCQHPADNNGSLRCLEALWRGFDPVGFTAGGGANFGVVAVGIES